MNARQEAAAKLMIETLLALPWDQRDAVFSAVKWNGIFCCSCGYGEPDHPNTNCQCQNDE